MTQDDYQITNDSMTDLNLSDNSAKGQNSHGQQGFASMDKDKQREIASKGGKAAHQQGTAHEWNSDEAKAAGRKGGQSRSSISSDSTDLLVEEGI